MSALILPSPEGVLGAGLVALVVLFTAAVVRSKKPDPKMAFLVNLLRSLPR
jgi:hypothetical protein